MDAIYWSGEYTWLTYYTFFFAWVMGIILGWQMNNTYRKHFKRTKKLAGGETG